MSVDDSNAPAPVPGSSSNQSVSIPSDALIIVPVRNTVLFPGVVFPITIGRPQSIAAAQQAVREQRQIGLLQQRDPETNEPGPDDLYRVGTLANIVRYITGPDDTHHVVCQGVQRIRVLDFLPGTPFLAARVLHIPEPTTSSPEIEARFLNLQRQAIEAAELLPQAPQELIAVLQGTTSPSTLADLATSYMDIKPQEKQEILETVDLALRMDKVSRHLAERIEVLRLSNEIGKQTKATFDERQREAILREQMATIQRQLGEGDGKAQEVAELNAAIAKANMPAEAESQARKEVRRYERMPEGAAEAGMVRSYLDWLIELPWSLPEEKPIDIAEARRILDEDHYGLEKIKSRIIEYLAVRKLAPQGKAPILCFVGPPGVGKTSLGQSIARAMERPFVRVSLGGVHDEAEIRGHRRTYIGALPGNIIQAIKKAGSRNCVMMLDEIDKMGRGIQGDPSAAMLEVLDPEQNATFRDNYLGVPFDLSRVVFVATANMLDSIPGPLLDRMEIISLAGYTEEEKLEIARRYLVRRQLEANGLKPEQVEIDADALRLIIKGYTREAGVRSLEREIGKAFRNVAVQVAEGSASRVVLTAEEYRAGSWPAPVRKRDRHAHQCARRCHRARLDAGRRRHSLHRSDPHGRQRHADPDRPAWRGHARKRAGRADPGEEPRVAARYRPCSVRKERHPRPCPRRRHAKGRTERGRRHVHRPHLPAHRSQRQKRYRHDRRNLAAGPGASGRRHQGKGRRRGRRRTDPRDVARAQPARLRRHSVERPQPAGVHLARAGRRRGRRGAGAKGRAGNRGLT